MGEMQDAMRAARGEKVHPPDAKLCPNCKGNGWFFIDFQAEFCRDTDTRQTVACKDCHETGIEDDARYAMRAMQPKIKKEERPMPDVQDKNMVISGRFAITFPKTYVWNGLDWTPYENPFYLRAKAEGRIK